MSASEFAQNWPRIAVVGAGAVGGYFGGMLARAGAQVTFIGRPAFVDAVRENGLFLDTVQFQEHVKVQASTDLTTARDAGIILFCVKTTDTTETARALAKVLAVAKASGIQPARLEDPEAALGGAYKVAEQMAATRSSTAQDMIRNKKTEIDSLNGFIVRRARELNIPVPVNHALFTLVKLAEGNS